MFRQELNIYLFVGIIMLIGIVKKNAIMMIDFAQERSTSRASRRARPSTKRCLVRFRPIMMTTMAALTGTLPIALGFGAGAEARRPLGLAVVGGIDGFAVADALHHPGLLPLHGEGAGVAEQEEEEAGDLSPAGSRDGRVTGGAQLRIRSSRYIPVRAKTISGDQAATVGGS